MIEFNSVCLVFLPYVSKSRDCVAWTETGGNMVRLTPQCETQWVSWVSVYRCCGVWRMNLVLEAGGWRLEAGAAADSLLKPRSHLRPAALPSLLLLLRCRPNSRQRSRKVFGEIPKIPSRLGPPPQK
jgi:hypothetical protein